VNRFKLGSPPLRGSRLRRAGLDPSLGPTERIAATLTAWGALVSFEHSPDVVEAAAGLPADGCALGWAHRSTTTPTRSSRRLQDILTSYLTTDLDALILDAFVVRRRSAAPIAFDDYAVTLRPQAQFTTRFHDTSDGSRETIHEIALDYDGGPRTTVSPAAFALLAVADGRRTTTQLAAAT
jgi:hypothetical protein